jgi:hypothetical protein
VAPLFKNLQYWRVLVRSNARHSCLFPFERSRKAGDWSALTTGSRARARSDKIREQTEVLVTTFAQHRR